MTETMYVVTSGEYSEYEINAICSTENKARRYIKQSEKLRINSYGAGFDIKKFELDVPVHKAFVTHVKMERNGDVNVWSGKHYPYQKVGLTCFHKEFMTYTVHEQDAKRAIQIVNEKRSVILAHNCWGDLKKAKQILGESEGVNSKNNNKN